jgi:hypothetical protein
MFDFEALYNNIEEYKAFRDDPEARREYQIWTDWKVRSMLKLIPEGMTFSNVLEVGSAFGVILDKVSRQLNISDAFGLDIAKVNTDMGKQLFPHLSFFTGTLENQDVKALAGLGQKKFDLVVLCDIIEHIPDELTFMRQVHSIAKYALINLPLEKSFANRRRSYGVEDVSGHLRSYNLKEGLNLLHQSGWEILNYQRDIVYHDIDCLNFHRAQRNARVASKPTLKKAFWSSWYSIEDVLLMHSKPLYIQLRGANLFALISSGD